MQLTIQIDQNLLQQAMQITHLNNEALTIERSLRLLIQQNKANTAINELKQFEGKVDLSDANTDKLRGCAAGSASLKNLFKQAKAIKITETVDINSLSQEMNRDIF
jgi:Arc/MetJ family transcription regulator